jgi:hypothetical protein
MNTQVLDTVAKQTSSELILFFVILAIALPSILVYMNNRHKKEIEQIKAENHAALERMKAESHAEDIVFHNWTEREQNLLKVITDNANSQREIATAIAQLTKVLETTTKGCDTCKVDQSNHWIQMDKRIDAIEVQIRDSTRYLDSAVKTASGEIIKHVSTVYERD